jgi:hypothetical protein
LNNRTVFALLVCVFLGGQAGFGAGFGEQELFCQEPDQGLHDGIRIAHSDVDYGSRVADNFTLTTAGSIEAIRWWGAYDVPGPEFEECAPIPADDFTVTFYTDSAGAPGTAVSTNLLGAGVSRSPTGNEIPHSPGYHYTEYVYTADLLEPFIAQAGVTYWVVIRHHGLDGCAWSVETAPPGSDGDGFALWDMFGGYNEYGFDVALCLFGQPFSNDPSLFCQGPDQDFHGGFSFAHSDADYDAHAADSFTLSTAALIERVRWWGVYEELGKPEQCDVIPTDNFTLTIYTDSGGLPGGPLSVNALGASAVRILTGETVPHGPSLFDEYVYTVDLPEPILADAGVTYWMEIVSNDPDACVWGWETAPPGTDGDGTALWDPDGSGYVVYAFDLAFCLLSPTSEQIGIVSADPPDGAIDARQPSDLDGSNPVGWESIEITFDGDTSELTPSDFEVLVSGSGIPNIVEVIPDGDTVTLVLDGRIRVAQCTTFRHIASGTHTSLGYLPGDVDNDGTSAPADILWLIDCLNEARDCEVWQCDADRDDECGPADILRVIDLLNGAAAFDSWLDATLPECP